MAHSELCKDYGVHFHRSFVCDGEPVVVTCPIETVVKDLKEYGYSHEAEWSRQTPYINITEEKPRINLLSDSLLLFPTKHGDSGPYECVLRNSTNCSKMTVILVVYENDHGMCFNSSLTYLQSAWLSTIGKIVCPDLDRFKKIGTVSQIRWYKECIPILPNTDKYKDVGDSLRIVMLTREDEGNYTCEATFEYNEKILKLTRTIGLDIKEQGNRVSSEIIFPMNTTIEVNSTKDLVVECLAVLGSDTSVLFWMVGGNFIEDVYKDRRVLENATQEILVNGTKMKKNPLIFFEVLNEDYGVNFECILVAGERHVRTYFTLKPTDTWYRKYVISSFVTAAFFLLVGICVYKFFKVDIVLLYRDSCYLLKKTQDDKMYDASIIYPRDINVCSTRSSTCNTDTFVLKCLPEILEDTYGYKLFIFGRDALPGQAVADIMDETILKSRRLLIVLTAHASDQTWLMFDQFLGLYNDLVAETVKVILVEMEKITDYRHFPESVQYIKERGSIVQWKGDYTEQSLSPKSKFWKKLRYLMPPRHIQVSHENHMITRS
ncbi:interleukin-1 receptor type 1-like isoform X2 [Protopterus annectens]|uniref:interleukin-1 receptor type 1-like isoform X2 n=1 Tax=Protopterus annectens TaxID=7888 RepID=UPI001CF9A01D|nr:interleukin-1 receptor type 1-like isoform X2 [Protopterus annectens]